MLAGFVAAVEYVHELGWTAIRAHERALGERFLAGLPEHCTLHGLRSMDGRVPTFAFTVDGLSPRTVAERLAGRELAVWDGDYYAVEVMARLGLAPEGAVRGGPRPLQHCRRGRPAARRPGRALTSRPAGRPQT